MFVHGKDDQFSAGKMFDCMDTYCIKDWIKARGDSLCRCAMKLRIAELDQGDDAAPPGNIANAYVHFHVLVHPIVLFLGVELILSDTK